MRRPGSIDYPTWAQGMRCAACGAEVEYAYQPFPSKRGRQVTFECGAYGHPGKSNDPFYGHIGCMRRQIEQRDDLIAWLLNGPMADAGIGVQAVANMPPEIRAVMDRVLRSRAAGEAKHG